MKQVFQDARTSEVPVVEVPAPKLLAGCVVVRTAASLVSAGTERASSEFASKNLLQKARMRPDLVREVLNKISRDGLLSTSCVHHTRSSRPPRRAQRGRQTGRGGGRDRAGFAWSIDSTDS